MRHLTAADYRTMPWANGRGTTIELLREQRADGAVVRLSMATVSEDGPFSIFPGIERNLTVIAGPGFLLRGAGMVLPCLPLVPVAFPGGVAVCAENTGSVASADFNVMTPSALPRPAVSVVRTPMLMPEGGTLFLFALGTATVNGRAVQRHDLIVTTSAADLSGPGDMIVVRLAP